MRPGKERFLIAGCIVAAYSMATCTGQQQTPQQSFSVNDGLKITVKQVAPGNQPSKVQIICYLKHKAAGDRVLEALVDFDRNTGGLIQSLRESGQFAGNERETLLFMPPPGKMKAAAVLLVGLGDEADVSLETMSRIGTTALREAVRMKAGVVSYASALKDQGIDRLDAGEVAENVIAGAIAAYRTEKKLQQSGNAARFSIDEWIYEAGPSYYKSTVEHVQRAVDAANSRSR